MPMLVVRSAFFILLIGLTSSAATADTTRTDVLHKYLLAYNAHDIDGMLHFMHDDVRWMSIDADQLSTETRGHDSFRKIMTGYFAHFDTAQSEFLSVQALGRYVSTAERASWIAEGESRAQCAMAMYEFAGELIVNVWYYGAEQCPE